MKEQQIKNILFDFGDVIINLDKQATKRELNKLGLDEFDAEMQKINRLYESGKIDTIEFLCFYQTKIPKATDDELIAAWNSIILDLPKYRMDFIKELTSQYRVYLLSNINPLHLKYIRSLLGDDLYVDFLYLFDAVFYSHAIKMRKPEEAPFQFVIDRTGIKPEETLFIDDTLENCETAKKMRFKTWHINPDTEDIINIEKHL